MAGEGQRRITVLLADDNLIVREGVRGLLAVEPGIELVGTAADYDELVTGTERTRPQVIVTDIRMPPDFQSEGITAAKEIRKRHPGTGVVVLSQYDEPDYVLSLLSDGAEGLAYLLKVACPRAISWSGRFARWRSAVRCSIRGSWTLWSVRLLPARS